MDARGKVGMGRFVVGLAGVVALVSGLAAFAPAEAQLPDNSIKLWWTAPGDDGNSGRATTYELRYRDVGITGADTTGWWSAATQVTGMPNPSIAGATDSVLVLNLNPSKTYTFVLRTADEVPNWSGYSNVVAKTPYVDVFPPARITDLSVSAAAPASPPPAGATRPGRN